MIWEHIDLSPNLVLIGNDIIPHLFETLWQVNLPMGSNSKYLLSL